MSCQYYGGQHTKTDGLLTLLPDLTSHPPSTLIPSPSLSILSSPLPLLRKPFLFLSFIHPSTSPFRNSCLPSSIFLTKGYSFLFSPFSCIFFLTLLILIFLSSLYVSLSPILPVAFTSRPLYPDSPSSSLFPSFLPSLVSNGPLRLNTGDRPRLFG